MRASFVQLPIEIIEDTAISPLELRLYLTLLRYGLESRGFSQAGHRFLAKKLGVHPQTIGRSIKNLEESGYISVEKICLNRNDKIRCLKTVKREKKKPSRVYHTPTTQTKHRDQTLTFIDKRTNKRDISGGIKMAPKYTDENNPYIPYIPLKTDEIITHALC